MFQILDGLRAVYRRYIPQLGESFESKDRSKQTRPDKASGFTSSHGDLTEGTLTTGVALTSQSSTTNPTSPGIQMSPRSQGCLQFSEELMRELKKQRTPHQNQPDKR
ncbi:uncharacterized protein [Haliotis asinina]|uniref:uncharacterized protein n=1 Tax=Haliotis asinina TaxID=109174 RepID=UPI0035327465